MRFPVAAALIAFCLCPQGSVAAPFTHDGCAGLRLVKRGNDLAVVCPDPARGFTVRDWFVLCAKTRALRYASGDVVVTCLERR